jgi:hypothetical protein
MTDPNYWLAVWQLFTALIFAGVTMTCVAENLRVGATVGFLLFAVSVYSALYCAGVVVVMP